MKGAPEFFWNEGQYKPCHGDNKATTKVNFTTESQKISTNLVEYRVRVLHRGKPILEFTLHGETVPTDDEVYAKLKKQAGVK